MATKILPINTGNNVSNNKPLQPSAKVPRMNIAI